MRKFLITIILILGFFESAKSQENKQYITEIKERYSDSISLSKLVKRINLPKV